MYLPSGYQSSADALGKPMKFQPEILHGADQSGVGYAGCGQQSNPVAELRPAVADLFPWQTGAQTDFGFVARRRNGNALPS
mgnify:CR=1 FL=1|jgi:hypothetical protein